MGYRKDRTTGKKINSTGIDIDGTPPWYLLQWSHSETTKFDDKRLCSHLYLYSDLAKYGPDYEVSIKYDFKSDNTTKDLKVRIIKRPPTS